MRETDKNFTIIYENSSAFVDFKVYEIIGHSKDLLGNYTIPFYEGIDGCGLDDKSTKDLEKANTFIRGSVKWDGCSHFYFGDKESGYIHLCGDDDIKKISSLIKKIYITCGKMMEETLEGEFLIEE